MRFCEGHTCINRTSQMSFEYMNEFIQNLPCVNNMCSSERNKLRRVLHFFSNYTAIDDNDVFTWKIQYFIQWYNRLQAASESLKTVDHNYLETPICFHQSTPIIYSQYPVWVQFVYILWIYEYRSYGLDKSESTQAWTHQSHIVATFCSSQHAGSTIKLMATCPSCTGSSPFWTTCPGKYLLQWQRYYKNV